MYALHVPVLGSRIENIKGSLKNTNVYYKWRIFLTAFKISLTKSKNSCDYFLRRVYHLKRTMQFIKTKTQIQLL